MTTDAEVERLAEIACDAHEGENGRYQDLLLTYRLPWQNAVRAVLAARPAPAAEGEVERLLEAIRNAWGSWAEDKTELFEDWLFSEKPIKEVRK